MSKPARSINKEYFRSSIFGIEDALVSTTGMVVGISAGSSNPRFVVMASLVTVIVEALSMGAGEYLSEKSVNELSSLSRFKHSSRLLGGIIMFVSYFLAGLVPVIPMLLFEYPQSAFIGTFMALVGLYTLGFIKGRVVGISSVRSGFQVLLVGGLATLAGLIVGILFRI